MLPVTHRWLGLPSREIRPHRVPPNLKATRVKILKAIAPELFDTIRNKMVRELAKRSRTGQYIYANTCGDPLKTRTKNAQVVLHVENGKSNATKRGSAASNVSSIASLVNGQLSLVELPRCLAPITGALIALRKTAEIRYSQL